MNINDIAQITVTLNDGTSQVYRGRGLEKFRKRIIQSPPLGGVAAPTPMPTVIEDDDEECPGGVCPMPKTTRKKLGRRAPPAQREIPSPSPEVTESEDPFLSKASNFAYTGGQGSGYASHGGYNYTPTSDNPMAAAAAMAKESGLIFGK